MGLLLVTAVGVLVRAWQLGAQSLWLDEAQFLQAALQPTVADLVRFLVERDFHPFVYPVLLRVWISVVPPTDVAVRALPLVFGVALIPLTAALARALLGRRDVALFAAAIVSLNSYHVYLSQEGRHYTWLALVGTLHLLSFLHTLRGGSRWWLAAFGATAILGLFSHYHMLLLLGGEAVVCLFRPRRLTLGVCILLAVAFFLLGWGRPLLLQARRRALWGEGLVDPGLHALTVIGIIVKNVGWTVLDFSTGNSLRLVGDKGFDAPDLIKGAVGVGVLVGEWRGAWNLRRPGPGGVRGILLLGCLGALPVAGAIASGFLQANVYETKYVSFVAPLWAILLATGCRAPLPSRTGAASGIALLVGLVLAVWSFHAEAIPWKEQWREAARILEARWHAGDVLLQRAPYTSFCLDHYLSFTPTRLESGTARFPEPSSADSAWAEYRGRGTGRLWVVLSHDEHATRMLRLLDAIHPRETGWTLRGIRIARYAAENP